MGEENNYGGYQPSDDKTQTEQPNGQYGQNYGQSNDQYGQGYTQSNGQYDQNYGQQNGQYNNYNQNYNQPNGQYDQYNQNYGQPYDQGYGQNYATQNMNMGGGPAYPQNNMQPNESNALSITSMILGIFSITLGCCITYIGIATAIAAIITGIISLKNKKPGKGMAIAGIITGAIAFVFLVICVVLVLTSDTYREMVDDVIRQIQSGNCN